MTDRIQHLVVALDTDIRSDDIEHLVAAISMIRGVNAVSLGEPVNTQDLLARLRVRRDVCDRLMRLIDDLARTA